MSELEVVESGAAVANSEQGGAQDGRSARDLEAEPFATADFKSFQGATIGILIGFQDEGRTPLVIFPGQAGNVAVRARAAQDVHGAHIGREVVLVFEGADRRCPIIVGCMQRAEGWPLPAEAGNVEVQADGERLIVSAREQLVLQCGKASITLTKAGRSSFREPMCRTAPRA